MEKLDKGCLENIASRLNDPRDIKRFLCVNKTCNEIGSRLWSLVPDHEKLGSLLLHVIKHYNFFKNIRITIHCASCPIILSPSRVIRLEPTDKKLKGPYHENMLWTMDKVLRISKDVQYDDRVIDKLRNRIYDLLKVVIVDEIIIWTKNGLSENNKHILKMENMIYEVCDGPIRVYRFRDIHHMSI